MKSHLCECNLFVVVAIVIVLPLLLLSSSSPSPPPQPLFFSLFFFKYSDIVSFGHFHCRIHHIDSNFILLYFVCICTKQSFWFSVYLFYCGFHLFIEAFWLGLTCGWMCVLYIYMYKSVGAVLFYLFLFWKGASFSSLVWLSCMTIHGNINSIYTQKCESFILKSK